VQGLVNGTLGGERVVGVDLGGDTSWDDLEDLLSELDEEAVESSIDLGVDVGSAVLLAVSDGNIHKLGILGLLGGSEDQGRVGGGILRLVLANSCLEVSIERRGVGVVVFRRIAMSLPLSGGVCWDGPDGGVYSQTKSPK
jgi:hypothetical protein